MNYEVIFLPLILLLSLLATVSKYKEWKIFHYITKPLAIISIILFLLTFYYDSYIPGKVLILTGLIFSAFGDIFLMFKEKYFKVGLLAFLLAHVCFTLFFIDGMLISKLINYYSLMIYILAGVLTYIITEDAKKDKIIISIYVFALASMVAFSIPYYLSTGYISVLFASGLFMISDSILGYNRFKSKLKYAELIILPTYFAAQLLFAYSIYV